MNETQRLFLAQARSAFEVFELLRSGSLLHHCHALHYLQMATELLGKASSAKNADVKPSHKALVSFLRSLSTNPAAQKQLGYSGQNESWKHTIRKSIPLANELQMLAPALAGDGPNPEYPWPLVSPKVAPCEFDFPIWKQFQDTSGRAFVALLRKLFSVAHEYL